MFGETMVSSQLRVLLFDLSILSLSDKLDLLYTDEANLFSSPVIPSFILSTGLSYILPFWRSSDVTGLL